MAVYRSLTITVSIDRDWRDVYSFTAAPENLQHWAAGLGRGLERSGDAWIAEDPSGRPILIRFSRPNEFGVLDHVVRAEGRDTLNPMRVVPNGSGAEVMFTLVMTPGMTEQAFAADAAAVKRDLDTLKAVLESRA